QPHSNQTPRPFRRASMSSRNLTEPPGRNPDATSSPILAAMDDASRPPPLPKLPACASPPNRLRADLHYRHASELPSVRHDPQSRKLCLPLHPQTHPPSPASPATSDQPPAPSPHSRPADSSHKIRPPPHLPPLRPPRARLPDSSSRKSSPKS